MRKNSFSSGRRRIAALASAMAAAATTVILATSGTAHASCNGYGCHGLDPEGQGCSASSTGTSQVIVNNVTLATLWNRYSGGCNSNWARGQLTSTAINAGDYIYMTISTTDSRGTFEGMCYPGPSNTGDLVEGCYDSYYNGSAVAWTDMVDGTNLTSANLYVVKANGTLVGQTHVNL